VARVVYQQEGVIYHQNTEAPTPSQPAHLHGSRESVPHHGQKVSRVHPLPPQSRMSEVESRLVLVVSLFTSYSCCPPLTQTTVAHVGGEISALALAHTSRNPASSRLHFSMSPPLCPYKRADPPGGGAQIPRDIELHRQPTLTTLTN